MGSRLDNRNADKVKKSIESFVKKIDDIVNSLEIAPKPERVFDENIIKTLRANFSPRKIEYPDIKEVIMIPCRLTPS